MLSRSLIVSPPLRSLRSLRSLPGKPLKTVTFVFTLMLLPYGLCLRSPKVSLQSARSAQKKGASVLPPFVVAIVPALFPPTSSDAPRVHRHLLIVRPAGRSASGCYAVYRQLPPPSLWLPMRGVARPRSHCCVFTRTFLLECVRATAQLCFSF